MFASNTSGTFMILPELIVTKNKNTAACDLCINESSVIYRIWVDGLVQEVWRLLEQEVLLHKHLLVKPLKDLRVDLK